MRAAGFSFYLIFGVCHINKSISALEHQITEVERGHNPVWVGMVVQARLPGIGTVYIDTEKVFLGTLSLYAIDDAVSRNYIDH